jgi:hypothetical protein
MSYWLFLLSLALDLLWLCIYTRCVYMWSLVAVYKPDCISYFLVSFLDALLPITLFCPLIRVCWVFYLAGKLQGWGALVAADRIRGLLQEQRLLLGFMRQPPESLLGCGVKRRSWTFAAAGAGRASIGRGGGRPWKADPKQRQPSLAGDGGPPGRRRWPRPRPW